MARRRKEDQWVSHHEAWEALRAFLFPCAAPEVSLLAAWCLSGATARGEPWTPAVTRPQGVRRAERAAAGGVVHVPRALSVATCAMNSCATRCSISPLVYPQLLATKAMTSRHTVGIGTYMDPPTLSRGSRMDQHASGQMQSYIRIWTPPDLQAENR